MCSRGTHSGGCGEGKGRVARGSVPAGPLGPVRPRPRGGQRWCDPPSLPCVCVSLTLSLTLAFSTTPVPRVCLPPSPPLCLSLLTPPTPHPPLVRSLSLSVYPSLTPTLTTALLSTEKPALSPPRPSPPFALSLKSPALSTAFSRSVSFSPSLSLLLSGSPPLT